MSDIKSYANKITKAAGIVFFGLVIGRLLTYIYIILLSRLGSSTYGLFTLALTIVTFLSTVTLLGLRSAILRYISFYKGKENYEKIKGTLLSSIKISFPFSILIFLIVFIFAKDIAGIFNNPDLTLLLKILTILIPIRSLSRVFITTITAFQKIEYSVLTEQVILNATKLITTFILILIGFEIMGPVIAMIITAIVVLILSFYFLERKVFPFIKTKTKAIYNKKELIIFALPLLFSDFLVDMAKWADTWFIGAFRTTSEVGMYNVALPTSNLLVLVPTAIMAIFVPLITDLYAKKKIKEIKEISKLVSKWIFFVNAPIILFLVLFSKDFIREIFGAEYISSYIVIIILAIGHIFYGLYHVPANILQMIKKTKTIFLIFFISVTLNLILNFILVPKYGMIGAAIGTFGYFLILYLLISLSVFKLKKMVFLRWIYLKSIISIGITTIIILQISKVINPTSVINLIILSLILFVIYCGILFILKGFEEEDKEVINSIKRKFIK